MQTKIRSINGINCLAYLEYYASQYIPIFDGTTKKKKKKKHSSNSLLYSGFVQARYSGNIIFLIIVNLVK